LSWGQLKGKKGGKRKRRLETSPQWFTYGEKGPRKTPSNTKEGKGLGERPCGGIGKKKRKSEAGVHAF